MSLKQRAMIAILPLESLLVTEIDLIIDKERENKEFFINLKIFRV